jgi:hypothetical protein
MEYELPEEDSGEASWKELYEKDGNHNAFWERIISNVRLCSVRRSDYDHDTFEVYLLHAVSIGRGVLPSGDYKVEPLNIAGGDAPVLIFRDSSNGREQMAVKIIPTLENRVQPETRVLYHHIGNRYYLDRIWVKGAIYGYKFELPKNATGAGER